MANEIRALVLEDEPADAELEVYQLERGGIRCVAERVDTIDGFRRALAEFKPDVVLSDFTLPSFDGMTALALAQEALPEVPFLFVSGTIGEERAIEALRRGATDYVLKTNLARLAPAVKRALQEARERDARSQAERQLRLSEERFRTLAAYAPVGIILTDARGDCLYVNDAWGDMTGFTRDRSLGRGWSAAIHPDERERIVRDWQTATHAVQPFSANFRIVTAGGDELWVIGRSAPTQDEAGGGATCIWTIADVTALRQQEQKIARLNRIHAVLSGINSAIVRIRDRAALFDEACRIAVEEGRFRLARLQLRAPEAKQATLGAARVATDGASVPLPGDAVDEDTSLAAAALRTAQPAVCHDVALDPRVAARRDALIAAGHRSIAALPLVVDGNACGYIALYAGEPGFFDEAEMHILRQLAADVSFALEHIERAEQLDYLAYFDPVTGLPNRAQFQQRLAQAIAAARERGGGLAVVFADIERFKNINDTLGRAVGDAVLRHAAERLQLAGHELHDLARVQADCFAGIVADFRHEERLARDVHHHLRTSLAEPLVIDGEELRLALRSGIAFYPNDGADTDSLMRNAEAALKQAKVSAESFVVYTPDINARLAEQLNLENRLRRAVDQARFTLHYQPKIDLATGRVSGFEALIRWLDEELGAVPPEKFVPLLEETGLILPVGKWAMRHAQETAAEWARKGLPPTRIAVNVSPTQLRERDFVAAVEQAIGGARPGIDFEITESVIMHNIEENIAKLRAARDLGLGIAIDDFGTGYSSLAYIAKLPVNAIKVDRSFVMRLGTDADSAAIVSSMINLAHSLQLKVIAEGVETVAQARQLERLGCDECQGFLYSPPVPAARVEAILRESRAAIPSPE